MDTGQRCERAWTAAGGAVTWPSRREFEARGLGSLNGEITRTESHRAMAARYGLPLQRAWRRRAGEPRPV
jgi:hypothetical protein